MKSLFTIDANFLSCVAMHSGMPIVACAQRALHDVGVAPFPSLNPTAFNVPTLVKPSDWCSASEPRLAAESPTIASIWRQGPCSQRAISALSRALPTPLPCCPSAIYTESSTVKR